MVWHKRLPLLAVAVLVLAALAYGFMPRPPAVETAVVVHGPLEVTVEQEGRTRVQNRYVLAAPVTGYLQRVSLEVGDPVAAGDRVAAVAPLPPALLDPRQRAESHERVEQAVAALQAAQAELEASEAQARLAAQEARRLRDMAGDGFVSAQDVDRANATERQSQAVLRAARFNVEVARHTLAAARAALRVYSETDPSTQAREWVGVHAPVAGQVLAVRRESEGPVSMGEPLLELGDPAFLEIVADVLSTDAVRIRPGQLVRIERWGGPTLSGRVRRVEPAGFTKISALGVEEQRVWVIVDLTSPRAEWRTLGDQYRVEATFVLWAGDRVLQVPDSALFRHQGGWAVFRLREGRARLTAVTTGHRAGLRVQILEGLSPGDEVITHPDDRIRDGMRVERSGT